MSQYVVPINEMEFSALLRYGEIKAPLIRYIEVPNQLDRQNRPVIDDIRKKQITDAINAHTIEDSVSILFLLINTDNKMQEHLNICIFDNYPALAIEQVTHIYSYCSDGILESRYPNIKFSGTLFPVEAFHETLLLILKKDSLHGADTLVQSIISENNLTNIDFTSLSEHAEKWLRIKIEKRTVPHEGNDLIIRSLMFGYNQVKPKTINKACVALGLMLNSVMKSLALDLEPYRKLYSNFKTDGAFIEIVNHPEFIKWMGNIGKTVDSPISLRSIAFFLKMIMPSQKERKTDIQVLYNEVSSINSKLEPEEIIFAIWLYGYYWGLSEFNNIKYNSASCKFLKTKEFHFHKITLQPYIQPIYTEPDVTDKLQTKKTESSCEAELSANTNYIEQDAKKVPSPKQNENLELSSIDNAPQTNGKVDKETTTALKKKSTKDCIGKKEDKPQEKVSTKEAPVAKGPKPKEASKELVDPADSSEGNIS